MPGFRSHYFFGDECQKAMEKVPQCILNHRNVYNLGQQGPDIFFYCPEAHLFYPKNIGFLMHSDRVGEFFHNLLKTRELFTRPEHLEIVDAYILGFMGHYSLDTVAHPYIHDRAKKLKYRHEFSKSFGIHVLLETDIDNDNVRHFLGCEPIDFNHYDTILVSKEEREVVSLLLEGAIKETYPDNVMRNKHVKKAITFSRKLFKMMVDPKGRKKAFVLWIDNTFFHHVFLSAVISNDDKQTYEDPCNLTHKEYRNPWNQKQKITKDFYELMEEAKGNYLRRVDLFMQTNPKDQKTYENLLSDLGDLSYDSGLPLPLIYPDEEIE